MSRPCERFEGAMALEALGSLPDFERPSLLAHLDGCASCRAQWRELSATAGALALVDTASVAPTAAVPPALAERVLGTLHREARSARRGRVAKVSGAAAVGALAASVLALVAFASTPSATERGTRTEVLHGPRGATATAVLTDEPWGTSIRLTEAGLPAAGVYDVTMRTSTGRWWSTGSFHGVAGRRVVAAMTCSVPWDAITAIRVTDAAGSEALGSEAPPGTSW